MKRPRLFPIFLFFAGLSLLIAGHVLVAAPASAPVIHVFASASLAPAFKKLAALYEKKSSLRVRLNFASAEMLAEQIGRGARPDLLMVGGGDEMNRLEQEGRIDAATRKDLLLDSLAVVGGKNCRHKIRKLDDISSPEIPRILIPDPRKAAVGRHARELLTGHPQTRAAVAKIRHGKNLNQTLKALKSSAADVAVLYRRQAEGDADVKILYRVPGPDGPRLNYAVALASGSENKPEAERFLRFLDSKEAGQVFDRAGFTVIAAGEKPAKKPTP